MRQNAFAAPAWGATALPRSLAGFGEGNGERGIEKAMDGKGTEREKKGRWGEWNLAAIWGGKSGGMERARDGKGMKGWEGKEEEEKGEERNGM